MSEYQYYEFQAIDRALTEREIAELRSCSSRAAITATRFVNHYDFGDFKGNSSVWMEKYFDAFLYLANWGTHELMIRFPRQALELKIAQQYCRGNAASARIKGDYIILEFLSQEEGDGDWDDGSGWLSSLIPLRSDLVGGDYRMLYLAWLLCIQSRELEDDTAEPPIPAGLADLTGPLQAFADFLHIDPDLITAAAARSPKVDTSSSDRQVKEWIEALPNPTKNDLLVRLAKGQDAHLRAELLRRFRASQPALEDRRSESQRTVGDLLAAAEEIAEGRRRKEAERSAAERARREREAAEARERYLADLAKNEAKAWSNVAALIATKLPGRYDEAVKLLCDLRDLGLRDGRAAEVEARLLQLREEHAKKPSLLERLKKAGLITGD